MQSTALAQKQDNRTPDATLAEELVRVLGLRFWESNRVTRLCNGVEIFPSMLAAIGAAKTCIEFQTFIYWGGRIAEEFAEALAKRAQDGVIVRVLLDAFGSARMPSRLVEMLRAAGVDVAMLRPLPSLRFRKIGHRSHRKLLVCDRVVAFTGGVGIASEWEGDARGPEEWRETQFRFEGPVVDAFHATFMENWSEEREIELGPASPPPMADAGKTRIAVIRASGGAASNDMRAALLALIGLARHSLQLVTAYFVPDAALTAALIAAHRRGVEVTLMLPGEHSDWRLCNLASGEEIAALVEAGLSVRLYNHTMLHAKITLVDSEVALVGSPNLNQRSLGIDDEVGAVILDEELIRTLQGDLAADLEHTEAFVAERWRERGPLQRVVEGMGRTLRAGL